MCPTKTQAQFGTLHQQLETQTKSQTTDGSHRFYLVNTTLAYFRSRLSHEALYSSPPDSATMTSVEFNDVDEGFLAREPLCLLDSAQLTINRTLEALPHGLRAIRSKGGQQLPLEIWNMVLGFLQAWVE